MRKHCRWLKRSTWETDTKYDKLGQTVTIFKFHPAPQWSEGITGMVLGWSEPFTQSWFCFIKYKINILIKCYCCVTSSNKNSTLLLGGTRKILQNVHKTSHISEKSPIPTKLLKCCWCGAAAKFCILMLLHFITWCFLQDFFNFLFCVWDWQLFLSVSRTNDESRKNRKMKRPSSLGKVLPASLPFGNILAKLLTRSGNKTLNSQAQIVSPQYSPAATCFYRG